MSEGITVYKNPQSRDAANRGYFHGGNNGDQDAKNVEKNQSKCGTRIAQGGSGGVNGGLTTGCEKTFGFGRSGGGNASNGDAGG
jgi:hypothetical protein